MSAITVWGLIKIRHRFNLSRFLIYICVGAVFGWSWNWFMCHFDSIPAWIYHPWAFSGIKFGEMILEDFLFYPICGALFFLVRAIVPNFGVSSHRNKLITWWALVGAGIISWYVFSTAGQSITLWFLTPGLGMLILSWRRWNLPRFFICGSFIVILSSVWDIGVNLITPQLPGLSWASQWLYNSISAIRPHSQVFLSHTAHPWAWIEAIPIEILPWFAIGGWVFIYSLAQLIHDKK